MVDILTAGILGRMHMFVYSRDNRYGVHVFPPVMRPPEHIEHFLFCSRPICFLAFTFLFLRKSEHVDQERSRVVTNGYKVQSNGCFMSLMLLKDIIRFRKGESQCASAGQKCKCLSVNIWMWLRWWCLSVRSIWEESGWHICLSQSQVWVWMGVVSISTVRPSEVYTQKHKIHMQCQALQTVVSSAQEQSGFAELKALQKSSTNCTEVRMGTVPHAYFTQFWMTGSLQK